MRVFCREKDKKMSDVVCLGELLIDFVPQTNGLALADSPGFLKAPGGAPGNVAVGLVRLGVPSGFLGMVGNDPFGHFLRDTLKNDNVDTTGLRLSDKAKTALAFVTLKADGDREFMFYRDPSADMLYASADVDEAAIRAAKILHYGSISLISEPSRSATLHAIEIAKAAGVRVSCDPNLREALWPNLDAAREGLRLAISKASLVKISDYEVEFLTGSTDLAAGARSLWHDGVEIMAVTKGPHGSILMTADTTVDVPGFPVQAVDTTGAGDGFTAGLLAGLLGRASIATLDKDTLYALARRANAVGALTTQKRGAIPALPTGAEVDAFLHAH
jgi:fructokinase